MFIAALLAVKLIIKEGFFMSMGKAFFAVFTLLFLLSGCETMEGFGRDVEKVGGEIEEEADR